MTIQLSISVWTVICYVLLMIILDKLLFKPVLKVMDERKERIKRLCFLFALVVDIMLSFEIHSFFNIPYIVKFINH